MAIDASKNEGTTIKRRRRMRRQTTKEALPQVTCEQHATWRSTSGGPVKLRHCFKSPISCRCRACLKAGAPLEATYLTISNVFHFT